MSDFQDLFTSALKGTGSMLGDAASRGAAMAVSAQLNEEVVDLTVSLLEMIGVPRVYLESEPGRKIAICLSPAAIHLAMQMVPDAVPEALRGAVLSAAQHAATAAFYETATPMVVLLRDRLHSLGEKAQTLHQIGAFPSDSVASNVKTDTKVGRNG